MATKIITPPTTEPVTLDMAKLHIGLYHDEFDNLIYEDIQTARAYTETRCNRAISQQTLELVMDRWPERKIYGGNRSCDTMRRQEVRLRPPVQSVVSVTYRDSSNTLHTIDPADYMVDMDSSPARVLPVDYWPTDLYPINAIRIRYTAGESPDNVPFELKQAIKLYTGHLFANREVVIVGTSVVDIGLSYKALTANYEVRGVDV